MPENEWTIVIDNFGGFAPAWFDNAYTYYGNKNQASAMTDISVMDPNVLTQGPGTTDLTGGDEAGELGSVLISSILKHAVSSNATYACGADKVFKITATAVSNASWPLTISAGTANVSTDLVLYQSKVYVFWNDTGEDGDIAQVTPGTPAIDDDWGSTVPTGAANLEDAPHYGIVGGDDVMYVTNGQYIATLDATTLAVQGLDFWTNSETVSVTWNWNRVIIAVNRPNISGSNANQSGIYKWNGVSPSWEGDPIEVSGELGALYTKNGITYVWWKDATATGGYNFGYINGSRLDTLRRYSGSLPNQAQVGEYEGFVAWISSNAIMLWGAREPDVPVSLFQYMSGEHATAGAFAAPFGTMLISSYASTEYSLAKASGYTTAARYKTIAFKVGGPGYLSQIDLIQVETEQMATGAKVDFTLTYNKAKSTQSLTQIAYAASLPTFHKILNRGPSDVEDFRLDLSFANGSATNPVKIRSMMIKGHFIKAN